MGRNTIIVIIVLILAVAIPVTVRLVQQQQQLKTRAQEACDVADPNACPDLPMYCEGSETWQCTGGYCDENISQCVRHCAAVGGNPLSCGVPPAAPPSAPPAAGPPDCNTLGSKRADVCGGQLSVYDTCTKDCKDGKRVYYCTDSRNSNCTNRPNGVLCSAEDSQCVTTASPPPAGGNVGVGGVDVGDCSSITIDGQDFRQHPGLVVNQTYNVRITMANTKVQTPQNSWKSGYSLRYTGGSASQLGLSTTNISVPNPPVDIGESRPFPVIVKPSPAGTYQFYWQMYNDQNQPFSQGQSGKCTPEFTVFTTLPGVSPSPSPGAPGGTCPVGTSVVIPDEPTVTRVWRCRSPDQTFGCRGAGIPPNNYTCANSSETCLACSTTPILNNFPFSQCGSCKNNPKTQTQDPNCEDPSATRDDNSSRCTRKVKIDSIEFRDKCIEFTCVQAGKSKGCEVCWGTSCELAPSLCTDSQLPFCQTTGTQRGVCLAGPAASPSPTPSPSPIPSPPAVRTACFFLDDKPQTKRSCSDEGARAYETHPMIVPFTLTSVGKKVIFVRFISTTGEIVDRNRVINFLPNPSISDAQCSHLVSGVGTQVSITATNIGPRARAKIKLAGTDAEITSWNEDKGEVVASIDKKIEGTNALELTRSDGKVARAECVLGTTTVAFAAQTQCKKAGDFSADNVTVKIFANVPTTQEVEKPEPLLDEKIKLDKDGKPTGFSPKLEKNKKYSLIVKAQGSLSKRIDFETKSGTKNLEAVTLLTGDIAPSSRPDGKINAVDRGEMIRQWNLTRDVARTADFNGDGRVNSIDYACMRGNINQSDEEFSPPVPKAPAGVGGPSPSPTATPSTSPSATPTGILPFRVSFDPIFTNIVLSGEMGTSSVQIIDLTLPQGPGQKTVYVQFFENNIWGPTPPQSATINLRSGTSI